ncbi:cytochrome P450 76A1-like [Carica papaya]|uniref:cytochrome P450 76A1-like n=1 Tax=Carica papaya TaxID=3649 RepID=UPI000B8CCE9B|nr:cytochrome P450 76A1-like [Carica papaya]
MGWLIFFPPLLFLLLLYKRSFLNRRLPPGPPGWPIVGNLFDLGTMPHRTSAGLRKKYGDILWLKIGAVNSVVILSTKAATEFFKIHDHAFLDRAVTEVMRAQDFHLSSLSLAPYGPYWRVLRRLVTVEMLVNKRIKETVSVRQKSVDQMLVWIEEEAEKKHGVGIHVARFVFLMTFNLLGNLMISRDLIEPASRDGSEFFKAMMGFIEWTSKPNLADSFPWLQWLDPQGLKKNMEKDVGNAIDIASKFVKERIKEKKVGDREGQRKDFLDLLLEFEGTGKDEPARFSERDINIFIMEIFVAGSETTSSTIEWALTELLLNPESMAKAKAEITQVLGSKTKVEENDIANLPYLQFIIKETLRLHPPIPFLVPRKARQDTEFTGYRIPKNTQALVNVWAIGRDPEVWDDPLSFKPERFSESTIDFKGQHYELIPFGAGKRMCAGLALAQRILHLVLASLLRRFDWELDQSLDRERLDMKEKIGVTMRKSEPLLAVPVKRVT